ncbi:hypothetical protein ACHAQJ_008427 [Trichoderma viride]
MAPLPQEGIQVQLLNRSAASYPSYMRKMNPVFTGLITPPESPIRYVQRESSDDTAAQSSVPLGSEASLNMGSANETQSAMEALFAAIRDTQADEFEQDTSFTNRHATLEDMPATPINIGNISETIYTIIEHAAEEIVADAMSPMRLNVSRLEKSLESIRHQEDALSSLESHLHREHTDIRDQNDTMSRQLDLHYRTIEQNVEEFRSQSKTMNTMIGAQADNLAATISMVSHLSQVVTNLPMALNQVVHTAVQQQTQLAIRDIMFAQQQAMFSVSDVSGTRRSVSSDENSSHCACNHHGLEIESMSSTQHSSGSIRQTTYNTSLKTNRGFRYTLRKLFKSNK